MVRASLRPLRGRGARLRQILGRRPKSPRSQARFAIRLRQLALPQSLMATLPPILMARNGRDPKGSRIARPARRSSLERCRSTARIFEIDRAKSRQTTGQTLAFLLLYPSRRIDPTALKIAVQRAPILCGIPTAGKEDVAVGRKQPARLGKVDQGCAFEGTKPCGKAPEVSQATGSQWDMRE